MHALLENSPGKKMLMLGNEAIARGAIEAGVAFATAYPGTQSSEIALQFFQISQVKMKTLRLKHAFFQIVMLAYNIWRYLKLMALHSTKEDKSEDSIYRSKFDPLN